ncbi:MAG: SurA N-terminal domain-containing protein [Rikenellaceae bacterium]
MATLNTLRTKFGIVLSAVIAFALLAFIFSLKAEMGFGGNDPEVLIIDDASVSYTEYLSEYNEIREQSGMSESTQEQSDMLANSTAQSLLAKYVLLPGFEELGIGMGENERLAVMSGDIRTQAFYAAFADRTTGEYHPEAVGQFLLQSAGNPQAEAAWNFINGQARTEREATKYMALIRQGAYANALEVKEAVAHDNKTYNGKWIGKRYSKLADSLFTVSDSEIKLYYNAHKQNYKQLPSRTINYTLFNIAATADDKLAIEKKAMAAGGEFAKSADLKAYVRENRNASITNNYVIESQLLAKEVETLAKDEMYGPELNNDVWRTSRVVSSRMAPDSVGISMIVLPIDQAKLADSLYTALSKGGDFAKAASVYTADEQAAQVGGNYGRAPYSAFAGEFADALTTAKEGKLIKIETTDMIQIVKPYNVGRPTKHYMVASIEYPIEPSQATIRQAHNDASLFAVNAKGTAANFKTAADSTKMTVRSSMLRRGQRDIQGVANSREIARWVYSAEVNDLSEIFKVDDGYVVAMLTQVDDNEYAPVESATKSIRSELLRTKKFEAIKSELSGSSFEDMAASLNSKIAEFTDLKYDAYYVSEVGVEPAFIGAVASSEVGVVSAPVRGVTGLFVFVVDSINESAEPVTEEQVKVRLQANAESNAQQGVFPAIEQLSNIKDLRGRFF